MAKNKCNIIEDDEGCDAHLETNWHIFNKQKRL